MLPTGMVTDFHTHAFPDKVADRATQALTTDCPDATAHHDGHLTSLIHSMDAAGIDRSVVCSIATKPSQFEPILNWSLEIASPRIVPLASVHPDDPDRLARLDRIKDAGLPGVKLHPYYQSFVLDAPGVIPMFKHIEALGLLVVCHTGFDMAFPRDRLCDPARIVSLLNHCPDLRFVATHLGAWCDWAEVKRRLLGEPILMELSYSFGCLPDDEIGTMLEMHPQDCILFGTDSPWQDQAKTLQAVRALHLAPAREAALLGGNAARLLTPQER